MPLEDCQQIIRLRAYAVVLPAKTSVTPGPVPPPDGRAFRVVRAADPIHDAGRVWELQLSSRGIRGGTPPDVLSMTRTNTVSDATPAA